MPRTVLPASIDPRDPRRLEAAASWIILATAAVTLTWVFALGWSLSPMRLVPPGAAIGVLFALGFFYRHRRPDEALASTLIGTGQLIAFTVVGLPLSYLAATLGRPMIDTTLLEWDRALGLDWRAYLAFVDHHPLLGRLFNVAYESLRYQMLLVVVALGLTGRSVALQRFLVAYMLCALVTIAVSAALPAMAMFVKLGLGPADYPNLHPSASHVHVAVMDALRAGRWATVPIGEGEGIITFPSLHAALAALLLVSFWPIPRLRWVGLVVNLAMIAATPIDGGHYFVDVIAGLALAALSLAAADAIATRRPKAAADVAAAAP